MKRILFAVVFVVVSSSYAETQQAQQEEGAQKFALSQGQAEVAPKIITSVAGSPCFKHTQASFRVGDKAGNLGLRANLGALASRKAEMNIEVRGNVQYYLCTPEESVLGLDKLDPTRFRYLDRITRFDDLRWNRLNEEGKKEMKETPLWITVAKDQAIWFKSGNSYTGLKPTEFMPMWNSVDEMPKNYQENSFRRVKAGTPLAVGPKKDREEHSGWREKWPYDTPPPIWKSAKYEWVCWTPVRNPEDVPVIRTLAESNFVFGGVVFYWDSPALNSEASAGSDQKPKPKPLTLNYRAKFSSLACCLIKQSEISDIEDLSLLEFRQVPLDQNLRGRVSVETGDVLVFLLDKYHLAIRPTEVKKSGPLTAVLYQRKFWPIASVASVATKKGDLTRSAR